MTEKSAKPHQPCDVTVTVSGDRGSGKSYLIAVLAQALRGAGHTATTEDHIPSALKAISDLSQPYNVTFREADPTLRDEATAVLHEAADEITTLRQQNEELRTKASELEQRVLAGIADDYRTNAVFLESATRDREAQAEIAVLRKQVETLRVFQPRLPDAEIARLFSTAMTYMREAVVIEMGRGDLNQQVDALKRKSITMRNEAEAREREAEAMIRHAITGERPAAVTPATIQAERRSAARTLSASDKLALANGADPDLLVGGTTKSAHAAHVIADSLDDHTQAIAEDMARVTAQGLAEGGGEASLASAIERSLIAGAGSN